MSVVIIGGNERMEQQYLIILITSTVAHKMVHCALKEAERYDIRVERSY